MQSDPDLAKMPRARKPVCRIAHLVNRWQQQSDQHRTNSYGHQQFDERQRGPTERCDRAG
jgi:hypothetical protein